MATLRRQLQSIVHDYMEEFGVDEVDLDVVAQWALDTGRYQRKPLDMLKQCKRELSRALRSEHHVDPQGREVRTMHPVRVKDGPEQLVIWADIRNAKPSHMRVSLQQRRQAILRDCYRHSVDTESYNDNNTFKVTLPLFSYDFNTDLDELKLPTDYPEGEADTDFDEDDEE